METKKVLYDYGGGQGDDEMDGEPLTREESIWVWSILITFTLAPVFVLTLIARHL